MNIYFLKSTSQIGPLPHLLIAIILTGQLFGQVNTESMRKAELQEGIHFSLGLNLAYMEGNSQIFQSRVQGRLDYVQNWGHIFAVTNQKVSSKDKQVFVNQGFAHLRSIKPLINRLDMEFFLQQEYNEFISLKSRQLAGGGIRINLRAPLAELNKANNFSLIGGFGLMYERESIGNDSDIFSGDPVHGSLASLVRSTNYLVLGWTLSNIVTLQSTSYYQVDVKRSQDYRFLSNSQLNLKLSQKLVINFDLNLRYDSEPPFNIHKRDLEFSQGLSYYFN